MLRSSSTSTHWDIITKNDKEDSERANLRQSLPHAKRVSRYEERSIQKFQLTIYTFFTNVNRQKTDQRRRKLQPVEFE